MKTPIHLLAACCFAGTGVAGPAATVTLAPAPPANPLRFLDGRVTFEVQERVRWEIRENNFDFNDCLRAQTDDNWVLNRFRLGVMLKPAPWLKIYAQTQDSREYLSDRPDFPAQLGAEGDDAFDLRQGYVEISNYDKCPWGLKIGRQVMEYGDGRLVGPSEWNNLGRTFDAVKLRYQQQDWSVEAFAGTVAVSTRGKYNQSDLVNGTETHREQVFSGLYFSTAVLPVQTTDVYAFHLHENNNALYQPLALGDTNFLTFGARVKSKPGAFYHAPAAVAHDGKTIANGKSTWCSVAAEAPKPLGFDYDAELAFQTGKVRGLDLTAFAAHGGLGYTFELPWAPRLGVEYNYASGDEDSRDRASQTFQNLFPSNHPRYGYMDLFSWQNMHNPALSLKAAPCRTVTVQADYHLFWLATNEDSWYRSNGTATVRPLRTPAPAVALGAPPAPLPPQATDADKFAGSELDFTVTYKPLKQLALQAGYSHFFAGTYLKDTGAHSDADFGYVQATIEF